MNKTRLPIIIIIVSLFSTGIVALLTVQRTMGAKAGNPSYTGMGDLQIFDEQQANVSSEGAEISRPYTGMGDLHSFEVQQANSSGEGAEISRPYTGMGDLHSFEVQQANSSGEAAEIGRPYTGMGDLHSFELQQSVELAGVSIIQPLVRACSNLSTSYGERDTGASAPAYVLRAMGCQLQR